MTAYIPDTALVYDSARVYYRADLSGANLSGALRECVDPLIPGWVAVDGRLERA